MSQELEKMNMYVNTPQEVANQKNIYESMDHFGRKVMTPVSDKTPSIYSSAKNKIISPLKSRLSPVLSSCRKSDNKENSSHKVSKRPSIVLQKVHNESHLLSIESNVTRRTKS